MATYRTPAAFQRAIGDRAKDEARRLGNRPGDLVTRFYLNQLLARVFRHDPDGWILKGGQALLIRWPTARHSRDLDLLATRSSDGLDDAVAHLFDAARIDLGDFLRFEYHSVGAERQESETRKVKFTAYCGTKNVGVVSVDIVTNLTPLGRPVDQRLTPPFNVDLGTPSPTVRMWPLEDHVADKIAAMYERRSSGVSSRVKDLVDLIVIATSAGLDGRTTHTALHREVVRRTAAGVDLELPTRFTVPDRRSWDSGYRAEATRTRGLDQQYRTLELAEPLADTFITPLLAQRPPGTWDHVQAQWT